MKHYSSTKMVIGIGSALGILLSWSVLRAAPELVKIESKNLRVEFNSKLYSHVIAKLDGKETVLGAWKAPFQSLQVQGNAK